MSQQISIVIIAALVLFSMYRRIRRTVTFQPLRPKRLIVRMVLLAFVGVLYVIGLVQTPTHLLFALLGLVLGGGLVYFAMKTTRFEQRPKGWFYRPNAWIGSLLIVLFIGRMAYRVYEVSKQVQTQIAIKSSTQATVQPGMYSTSDPLTAIVLFTLIAYYVRYSIFLLRQQQHLSVDSQSISGS